MTTNTILKIVVICTICAATLLSGCVEVDDPVNADNNVETIEYVPIDVTPIATPNIDRSSPQSLVNNYMNSVRSKYDKALFDESYLRSSDGFEVIHEIRPSESYSTSYHIASEDSWQVRTWTNYPAYDDMHDDEDHQFTVYVKHYSTVRKAHGKMVKDIGVTHEYHNNECGNIVNLTYGDISYRLVNAARSGDDPDEITGYSANIFILDGQTIGRLHVSGYSDQDECEEVARYYLPFFVAMVENIE